MLDQQKLLIEKLSCMFENLKVGILVKGIENISIRSMITELSKSVNKKIYVAANGYDIEDEKDGDNFIISPFVEKAVKWRDDPDCIGSILVIIKDDTEKLHSLAEFDLVTYTDLSKSLLETKSKEVNINNPIKSFWEALYEISDHFSFEVLLDFINNIHSDSEITDIPCNLWRLNLLPDDDILSSDIIVSERLRHNKEIVHQLNELDISDRNKINKIFTKKNFNNDSFINTYNTVQKFHYEGNKETLSMLTLNDVEQLFSLTSKPKQESRNDPGKEKKEKGNIHDEELNSLVADSIIYPQENSGEDLLEVYKKLKDHYDDEEKQNDTNIGSIGGAFDDRIIDVSKTNVEFRQLIGKVCNENAWGALVISDKSSLKDAVYNFNQTNNLKPFVPSGTDGHLTSYDIAGDETSLFKIIEAFNYELDRQDNEHANKVNELIEKLIKLRNQLIKDLDLILNNPLIIFASSNNTRETLNKYINTWQNIYSFIKSNLRDMNSIDSDVTKHIAKCLLRLDVLYVETCNYEYKAILLPTHPLFLWNYYEIFSTITDISKINDGDKKILKDVLCNTPQILDFIPTFSIEEFGEITPLQYSGSIEGLPTYENKTNRFSGIDGINSIERILKSWMSFSPFTTELRICSVDVPSIVSSLKSIKNFINEYGCDKVIYDIYLTRNQNSNSDIFNMDFSGADYKIGEYIRNNNILLTVSNKENAIEVKRALAEKPVHIAFYFDQSEYHIEYNPSKKLTINPLVVTYDYKFNRISKRGQIFPSSNADSGLFGDLHQIMEAAGFIKANSYPSQTPPSSQDLKPIESALSENCAQWLSVIDKDTKYYHPENSIPIGSLIYGKRTASVWASYSSRIVDEYLNILRKYNLNPKRSKLINILNKFGHIASNGLITIPKYSNEPQAIDTQRKGLIGTLLASEYYTKDYEDSFVISLDNDMCKWLKKRECHARADLIGFKFSKETLYVHVIEVKTRDDSPDAKYDGEILAGHAVDQILDVASTVKNIFYNDDPTIDIFNRARRECLKFQTVTECLKSIHDPIWQEKWINILTKAFNKSVKERDIDIKISGLLYHIKLNENIDEIKPVKQTITDKYSGYDFDVDYFVLGTKSIQKEIFSDGGAHNTEEDSFQNGDYVKKNTPPQVYIESDNDNESIVNNTHENVNNTIDSTTQIIQDQAKEYYIFDKKGGYKLKDKSVDNGISEEIKKIAQSFISACTDYKISLKECNYDRAIVGPSIIQIPFKLGRGQSIQKLRGRMEDISRQMNNPGNVLIRPIPNSEEIFLEVPRKNRQPVMFKDIEELFKPNNLSPEKLPIPIGRTPNGMDLIKDLGKMPHMLVAGTTGSGKSMFLKCLISSILLTHPHMGDIQLIICTTKSEDLVFFEDMPQVYSNKIITSISEATVIEDFISEENEKRSKILHDKKTSKISEYNQLVDEKMYPIVVIIDEFSTLVEQGKSKKDKDSFLNVIKNIARTGRNRGIHLVLCTQRPSADTVLGDLKSQLNARVSFRVNSGLDSRIILDDDIASSLQPNGDLIYKNSDEQERALGYFIDRDDMERITSRVKTLNNT